LVSIRSWFRSRAALQVEILPLRHQLSVLKRSQRGRSPCARAFLAPCATMPHLGRGLSKTLPVASLRS
jgi:hypothetical protein